MSTPITTTRRRAHPLGLVHRYGGITAALLVIVVCITGILLNHADELGLAETNITSTRLLNWYGITAAPTQSFAAGNSILTQAGTRLYLNAQAIEGNYAQLQGFVAARNYMVAIIGDSLLVLKPDGAVVEILEQVHGIPADIQQIGLLQSLAVVATPAGIWQADAQLTHWQPLPEKAIPKKIIQGKQEQLTHGQTTGTVADTVHWSSTAKLPEKLALAIRTAHRGDGLPLERIILDLHSGRILGRAGAWAGDAVALLFISLALTGIWMWFKTRRRQST